MTSPDDAPRTASTRKAAPRKAAARKSAPRKTAPRKAAARKSQSGGSEDRRSGSPRSSTDDGGLTPSALARQLTRELAGIIGREPEGVISLERSDDGWRVGIEVVELRRIPDTADVIAEYEVEADRRGELVGYRRVARYTRGRTRDD